MNKKKIKRDFIKKHQSICPVCKKYYFSENYEICPVCGWENDPVQRKDKDFKGGANKLSVNEAIEVYENEK